MKLDGQMNRCLGALAMVLSAWLAAAQSDSTAVQEALIEIFQEQNLSDDAVGDNNAQFEFLDDLRRNPLDLNTATDAQLEDLRILSPIQITELQAYKRDIGLLLSVFELQAIPYFDMVTIRRLLPFVDIGSDPNKVSVWQAFSRGNDDVLLRWTRRLEKEAGYFDELGYLGDPNRLYLRYRHHFEQLLSYGFTAEKDPGEEFFEGSNRQGFDYYSAHLFVREASKTVKAVALGDFGVSFGQGLLLNTGFGALKSPQITNIRRMGLPLRAYTSVNEANFMRGVGTTLAFGNLEATIFGSRRLRDATAFVNEDTLDIPDEVLVSSLQSTGLHRTATELQNENALTQHTLGARFSYRVRSLRVAINGMYNQFDKPVSIDEKPYNKYYFRGSTLAGASVDYDFGYRNLFFFGEVAADDDGNLAQQHSVLASLTKAVSWSVVFRDLSPKYRSLYATPFGESSNGSNERGLFMGLEIRATKHLTINAYGDSWQHPWLRFNASAPSTGAEFLVRATYTKRKDWDAYLQFRHLMRELNTSSDHPFPRTVMPTYRSQWRLHFSQDLTKRFSYTSRMEYLVFTAADHSIEHGFMMYLDVGYKIPKPRVSLRLRATLFDTEGYNSRIYAFENDITLSFSAPPLYGRGYRYYSMISWKVAKNITLEGRAAQSWYTNRDYLGSGLSFRDTNKQTDVNIQLRLEF